MPLSAEKFEELVPKAAKAHSMTYCINKGPIPTLELLKMACVKCPEFVLNKGICDPL